MEALKSIRPQWPDLPVIITSHGTIETAVEAAWPEALDPVSKPFTPDELRKVAADALAEERRRCSGVNGNVFRPIRTASYRSLMYPPCKGPL